MKNYKKQVSWLGKHLRFSTDILTPEFLIFLIIVAITIVSRLYNLGTRVMSHDESLHAYFSWLFSQGQGFQHTPLMHGPLQFHLIAFLDFLFGSSDFIARLPHAIASILTVILIWKWRRYLGRAGVVVAAGMMLISPFMLYYGRYARNEALVVLFGLLMLFSMLRYFETGKSRFLLLFTVVTALHFTTKETAFIYSAQAMIFLAICLIFRVIKFRWKRKYLLVGFVLALVIGLISILFILGMHIIGTSQGALDASQTSAPIVPGTIAPISTTLGGFSPLQKLFFIAAILALLAAMIFLFAGIGWRKLRKERMVDMLILLITFVLPQLAAFPVKALGWDPLAYEFTWPGWNISSLWAQAPFRTGVILVILISIAVLIGLLWDPKRWVIHSLIFWGIYMFFFTSVFTNWEGLATGMVGSLGYWLVQQGVQRGGQPWYYYLLIELPLYEFLPIFGAAIAVYFGIKKKRSSILVTEDSENMETGQSLENLEELSFYHQDITFPLLIWWAFSSFIAYTIAGEKMPWLSVHIVLPLILLSGWGLGKIIEKINWKVFQKSLGWLTIILIALFIVSFFGCLTSVLGTHPPFQGKTLDDLNATNAFILRFIILLVSGIGIAYYTKKWNHGDSLCISILAFGVIFLVFTVRDSFRSAFVNYDNAREYLVYAHGASGVKDVVDQITDISQQVSGGTSLQIAYDANLPKQGVSWPFKWYLRNFPNAVSFDKPDASLLEYPVVIVDQNNFYSIKSYISLDYFQYDYIRMVWPNQDYFGLNFERIRDALSNPIMREALGQIWLNRDYTLYAQATDETGFDLFDWEPSDKMEIFIRKDVATQLWQYNISNEITQTSDTPTN